MLARYEPEKRGVECLVEARAGFASPREQLVRFLGFAKIRTTENRLIFSWTTGFSIFSTDRSRFSQSRSKEYIASHGILGRLCAYRARFARGAGSRIRAVSGIVCFLGDRYDRAFSSFFRIRRFERLCGTGCTYYTIVPPGVSYIFFSKPLGERSDFRKIYWSALNFLPISLFSQIHELR